MSDLQELFALAESNRNAFLARLTAVGVDKRYDIEQTALISAVASKKPVAVINAFIEAGADVNLEGGDGMTALMWASSPDIVAALIDAGANVNLKNKYGGNVLMLAMDLRHSYRYIERFDSLEDVSEVIIKLVKAGADVNEEYEEDKETALIRAVGLSYNDHPVFDINGLKALVNAIENVNSKDTNGETALMKVLKVAKSYKNISGTPPKKFVIVMASLIKNGASFDEQNPDNDILKRLRDMLDENGGDKEGAIDNAFDRIMGENLYAQASKIEDSTFSI